MPTDFTEYAYGEGSESLPPEPAVCLPFAKSLDEIARQGLVVARTRISQEPNG
jgi:hypothetical protein